MNYIVIASIIAISSCAHTHQDILRNQPPITDLHKTVEIWNEGGIGYGAPVFGNRIVTSAHLLHGNLIRYRAGEVVGKSEILTQDYEDDLAVLQAVDDLDVFLTISKKMPEPGEEVYWVVRHVDGHWGFARGWYIGQARGWGLVTGWFGPGTSGSPVLRADGTLWGIASSGYNWSCVTNAVSFAMMSDEGKFNCLFRMSQFPPEMQVRGIVGVVR